MNNIIDTGAGIPDDAYEGSGQFRRRAMLSAALSVPFLGMMAPAATASSGAGMLSGMSPSSPGSVVQERLAQLRFGMFVHFGPSAVVGREIGWGRNAYRSTEGPGNQYRDVNVTSDPVYDNAYRSFLPAVDWAEKLVDLAVKTGMRYLVFTTKHHDGFANFLTSTVQNSFYPDFAATPLGRSGRDLVSELAAAVHKTDLKLGFYYSGRDWTQPQSARKDFTGYLPYMKTQVNELMKNYGKVDFLWYDSLPYATHKLFDPPYFDSVPRALQPGILINNRVYDTMGFDQAPAELTGDYSTPEEKIGEFNTSRAWESCMTLTPGRWSWAPGQSPRSSAECIKTLVGTAIGDGNLLLNVGPMSNGYVESKQQDVLAGLAAWVRSFGASIYGTRGGPLVKNSVGGATCKGNKLYLHVLEDRFGVRALQLPKLPAKVVSAKTMADNRSVAFTRRLDGSVILLVNKIRPNPAAVQVLELTLDAPIDNSKTLPGLSWVL